MQNAQKQPESLVAGLKRRLFEIEEERHFTEGMILGIQTIVCPKEGIEVEFVSKRVRFDAEGRITGESGKPSIPSS